jgi:hypothetical protein
VTQWKPILRHQLGVGKKTKKSIKPRKQKKKTKKSIKPRKQKKKTKKTEQKKNQLNRLKF